MIYLLHISDLHLVADPQWNNMKNAILYSVRRKLENVGCGQKLLVMTGDFHNFIENNYHQAEQFLPRLINAMGIEPGEDVFLIPGNHDVSKDTGNNDREMRIEALHSKPEMLQKGMNQLLSCYDDYAAFVKKINPYYHSADKNPVSVHVRTWRNQLNILHLNTTLTADGGAKDNQMTDTLTATSDEIREQLQFGGLPCIALGHNSFHDLLRAHQDQLAAMFLQENISAYLCGDRHKRNSEREKKLIVLGGRQSVVAIPNIVSYRSSADEGDTYSDFGMIWHLWDEQTGRVTMEFMRWNPEDQAELYPDGEEVYEFRRPYRPPASTAVSESRGLRGHGRPCGPLSAASASGDEEICESHGQAPALPASAVDNEDNCWISNAFIQERGMFPVKDTHLYHFLRGGRCEWNLAFSNRIVFRDIVGELYDCVIKGGIYVLTAPGGEGKTTILRQLCAKLVSGGISVFYYRGYGILKIPQELPEQAVFVLDNPPSSHNFKHFLNAAIESGRTLILGARQNEWNLLKAFLRISDRDVIEIPLNKLTKKEAWRFADCVIDNLHCSKSKKEIKELFENNSYGFLYAAMLMVVNNKDSLEEIAKEVIGNLSKRSHKAMLLLAHIVLSEWHGVKFSDKQFKVICGRLGLSPKEANKALSREVSLNGDVYQTRHNVISRLFYHELFSDSGLLLLDEIDAVLENLIAFYLGRCKNSLGRIRKDVKESVLRLSNALPQGSMETQKYLMNRIFDEIKSEPQKVLYQLPSYFENEETRLLFYQICFEREYIVADFLPDWCGLLLKRKASWSTEEPYSPAWIMRNACIKYKAGSRTWLAWAQMAVQENQIGSYDTENTARWIFREACVNRNMRGNIWHEWALLEARENQAGDYDAENTARWIYREACVNHKTAENMTGTIWREWARLEVRENQVGDYDAENTARWIFREACTKHEAAGKIWREWAQLEIQESRVGDYDTENTARWIYREACMNHIVTGKTWQAWAQLEIQENRVGDYDTENTARWIYHEACVNRNVTGDIWQAWALLEVHENRIGDYSLENTARWIFREACVNRNAAGDIWQIWARLEAKADHIGEYDIENTARWIYREACVNQNASSDTWAAWAQLEVQENQAGDYDTENTARWIYREACVNHNGVSDTWTAWAQLEVQENHVGNYDIENTARWIYREACVNHNAVSDTWAAWAQLEVQENHVGNYDIENTARWIYREACRNCNVVSDIWAAWAQLEAEENGLGDYDTENTARWIYREACLNRNAGERTWQEWAQLEAKENQAGSYDSENTARWIYREACINRNAGVNVWQDWALFESCENQAGDYAAEHTARWIYREACVNRRLLGNIWADWARLEIQEDNVGDYDIENTARWICREACVNYNNAGSIWQEWARLEIRENRIGGYDKENTARWIFHEGCVNRNAPVEIWSLWAQLEAGENQVGDYDTEYTARWITAQGIKRFPDNLLIYSTGVNIELSVHSAQRARNILRQYFQRNRFPVGKLTILELLCGNIQSEDSFCVNRLMIQLEKNARRSVYELIYLYHCCVLLGRTKEAEKYFKQLLLNPEYDIYNERVEAYMESCREALA